MSKLIDKLLDNGKDFVKDLKKPLQKRKIKRGLESALDKVEGIKLDAESSLNDLRLQLVKAKSEEEIAGIFNDIASELQTISDSENTKVVLVSERKTLFEEEAK